MMRLGGYSSVHVFPVSDCLGERHLIPVCPPPPHTPGCHGDQAGYVEEGLTSDIRGLAQGEGAPCCQVPVLLISQVCSMC